MTLDNMVQDASSGLFVPPQSRRQVIPWDDLQALNPPTDNAQISPNLISALSIMVAQGRQTGKLVSVDDSGALKTAARLNAVTRLAAPLPALATVATVLDTSQFYPGDHVALIQDGSTQNICVDVVVNKIDSPTQMEFFATCGSVSFQPGDWVLGENTVNVRQVYEPVDVKDRAARQLGQVDVTDRFNRQVGVVTAGNPANWQAPFAWNRVAQSIAANSVLNVIAPVANENVWLFWCVASTDTALASNALLVERTDGAILFDFGASAAPLTVQFGGQQVGVGLGVRVHNGDSVAHVIRCGIGFAQA